MTSEIRDGAWWAERLDVPRWNSRRPGSLDFHAHCPACGSRDNLHVTDRPGTDALVHCFGCEATYADLLEELDTGGQPILVHRVRGPATTGAGVEAPAAIPPNPLEWYANYCGFEMIPEEVDPETGEVLVAGDIDLSPFRGSEIADLRPDAPPLLRQFLAGIPVTVTDDGWLRHNFRGLAIAKDRMAGTHDFRWLPAGVHNPGIWPLDELMPRQILLVEGESCCVALRGVGYVEVYAITGGAAHPPTIADFRAMVVRGVERVIVGFDADEKGREGSAKAVEAAMAAGLDVATVVPPDYDSLSGTGKDWRDWVLAHGGPERTELPAAIDGLIESMAKVVASLPVGGVHSIV